ncbi:MAG: hypothetical protein PHV20_14480 [Bacteroidales bacterium]|nr:hypothetical protein [Bacteroidales bacterium]
MRIFLASIALVLFTSVYAAKEPMKYGKVDKADIEMTTYPLDTTASAVVLCNYGYFDSQNFQFVHQRRIKILKDEGKSWGDFVVPGAEDAQVKGQTINIENGKIVVSKLQKESKFIEKVSKNRYNVRVSMPNVKAGSVIDFEVYYQGLPSYWRFQEKIPVRWSELIIEPNSYLSFRKNYSGYVPIAESSDDRWVTKDVPAFKSESYINNAENYLTQFDIEISMIHVPGRYYKEYATTWEAVVTTLRKDEDFGQNLNSLGFFGSDLVHQIKKTESTPEGRLVMAYNEVKKIKWNKHESLWISNRMLSTAYNEKVGNSADINLILTLFLRKLGIDANPVVLSTRDHGVLPLYSVSLSKLNYVIVQATIGEQTFLLDATEENLPINMLPERVINGRGLVVKDDTYTWTDITPTVKNKTSELLDLELKADGTMKGNWSRSFFDYAALDQRIEYKSFNSQDEYLKSLESASLGLSIEDYKLTNLDSLIKPLKENFNVILKNRVTKTNNQLFIEPVLFDKWTENPFKLQKREYPVDFTIAKETTQVLRLKLPEGYEVEQLPQNAKITLPENAGSLVMQSVVDNGIVQVVFKLNINKPVFLQNEYDNLKIFFDQLVKKQSEMLVIKKV